LSLPLNVYTFAPMNDIDELLGWFSDRTFEATAFIISAWEKTANLANCINLAITQVKNGNKNSVEVLRRIKAKIEELTVSPVAPAQA
jgi:hypothetical protein